MYILALLATFISLTLSSDQLVLFQSEEEFDESTKSGTWVVMLYELEYFKLYLHFLIA